jgi:dienelactone hydrolase
MPRKSTVNHLLSQIGILSFSVLAIVMSLSSDKAFSQIPGKYFRADGQTIEANILPAPGHSCAPLAIVSHGLGGTKDSNFQLATTLNRSGYRVIVPTHAESGPRQLISSLRPSAGGLISGIAKAASSTEAHRYRMADVNAVLTVEEKRCHIPHKLLAGHSMGAQTTLLEAGAKSSTGIVGRDRFDIYVAVSAAGEGTEFFPSGSMRSVRKPTMVITGTLDESVAGPFQTRLSTYHAIPSEKKRLAIIQGANHLDLGGRSDAVGAMVGTLATEFATQIKPGPWGQAKRHFGVVITDTAR